MPSAKFRWFLIILSAFFCVLMAIGMVRLSYIYYKLTSDAYLVQGHPEDLQQLKSSLSDQKIRVFLAELDLMSGNLGEIKTSDLMPKDAGPFLNPRVQVDWLSSSKQKAKLIQWQKLWPSVDDKTYELIHKIGIPNISEVLLTHPNLVIAEHQNNNADGISFVNFQTIDDTWLDTIQQFDYWDLDSDSPLSWEPRLLNTISVGSTVTEFITLTMIKQFFRHKKQGTLSQLREKIEHLLRLMISTEHDEMLFAVEPLAYRAEYLLSGKEPSDNFKTSIFVKVNNLKALLHPSTVERADVKNVFRQKSGIICMALSGGAENLRMIRRYNLSDTTYDSAIQDMLAGQSSNCRFSRLKLKPYNTEDPSICSENMDLCRFSWVFGKPPTTLLLPADYAISKLLSSEIKASMAQSVWNAHLLIKPLWWGP